MPSGMANRGRPTVSALVALLLAVGLPPLLSQPNPAGAEFQVNSYTPGSQDYAAVAMDARGDFVVVWESGGVEPDTSLRGIRGQRFAASGAMLGDEFQVNAYTTGDQQVPTVGMASGGAFVVAWESLGSYGSDQSALSIQARRFAADGTPLGPEQQVNTLTTDSQREAALAVRDDGSFLVTWWSNASNPEDPSGSVRAQLFGSDGMLAGSEFLVNSYTSGAQGSATLAATSGSGFIVVWGSNGSNGSDDDASSIQARLFDASGEPSGDQFQVNTYTTGFQSVPALAVAPNGRFLVTWENQGQVGSDTEPPAILGQLFEPDGGAVGAELQINTYTTSAQIRPAATALATGEFVVTWGSNGSSGTDTDALSVHGQVVASDGELVGAEFQVNTLTAFAQFRSSVAAGPGDRFVVVWQSSDPAQSLMGIRGQRYGSAIFSDGFESGDTIAWSATVP